MYPYYYLGTYTVSTYYVMAALGSIAGFLALLYNTRAEKKSVIRSYFIFAALIFIPFYAGARLGYIVECIAFKRESCGLGFFGAASLWPGLVTATLCAFPLAHFLKTDVWKAADYFSPSIAIGGFFMRLGCLLRGCCFGTPCPLDNPLGTFFSPYSSAYSTYGNVPLYPSQVFSSLAWLVVFIILEIRISRKSFKGEIILIMTFLYSLFTLIIDRFRYHDTSFPENSGFSIFFMVVSAILYALFYRKILKN